jgi:hypoxanthine phosphoribosyltransferase
LIITKEEIHKRIIELGNEITEDYKGKELDVVCLMNGASMFCQDILRHIDVTTRIHYLGFDSYVGDNLNGEVRITQDIKEPMQNKHVLIIEGIVISGRTPKYICELLKLRRPASMEFCVVGVKKEKLTENVPIRYEAFELGNEIVVGYGIGNSQEKTFSEIRSI